MIATVLYAAPPKDPSALVCACWLRLFHPQSEGTFELIIETALEIAERSMNTILVGEKREALKTALVIDLMWAVREKFSPEEFLAYASETVRCAGDSE